MFLLVSISRIITSLVLGAIPTAQLAQGDTQKTQLIHAIEQNSTCFDNLQVEFIETINRNGNSTTIKYRLYTREGNYVRIDSEHIEPPNGQQETVRRERLIVTPVGYVYLISAKDEGPLALNRFGTSKQGMEYLYSYPFYKSSLRGYFAYSSDILAGLSLYKHENWDSDGKICSLTLKTAEGDEYSYGYDLESGVCHSWKENLVNEQEVTVINKKYTGAELVPFEVVRSTKAKERDSFRIESKLVRTVFKNEAAPLGLFSFEIQGVTPTNQWRRRLVAIGIVFLACVLSVYWWSKRSSRT